MCQREPKGGDLAPAEGGAGTAGARVEHRLLQDGGREEELALQPLGAELQQLQTSHNGSEPNEFHWYLMAAIGGH